MKNANFKLNIVIVLLLILIIMSLYVKRCEKPVQLISPVVPTLTATPSPTLRSMIYEEINIPIPKPKPKITQKGS